MMYLLDVNVLIALGQQNHVHHQRARSWFYANCEAWASCPLTENAFIRILGHVSYEDFEGGTDEARRALNVVVANPGHQFWPDEVSLLRTAGIPRLPVSRHLTDFYLLALAVYKGGRFATLDERIDPALVRGGATAYLVIPGEE